MSCSAMDKLTEQASLPLESREFEFARIAQTESVQGLSFQSIGQLFASLSI